MKLISSLVLIEQSKKFKNMYLLFARVSNIEPIHLPRAIRGACCCFVAHT